MDPELEQYRTVVRDEWTNGHTVAAWARWHPKITGQQVNMREALIEHARLEPGMRVLDLACGTGDPAIEIARKVGPNVPRRISVHRCWASAERTQVWGLPDCACVDCHGIRARLAGFQSPWPRRTGGEPPIPGWTSSTSSRRAHPQTGPIMEVRRLSPIQSPSTIPTRQRIHGGESVVRAAPQAVRLAEIQIRNHRREDREGAGWIVIIDEH
jgi:hypothetical protein